jgi:hypothetical protein
MDTNITKEVVIAFYDRDIEWVNKLDDNVKVSVYRKGNQRTYKGEIVIDKHIGRDVHTFFYHIVNRYYTLSDYTFFAQDYPFDHIENYIDIINGTQLEWDMYSSYRKDGYWGYHWNSIGTMWSMDDSVELGSKVLKCDKFGKPHHPTPLPIELIWNSLFSSECPEVLEFTPGAHFSISKEQVLTRSLEFYKEILILLENNEFAPWVIERLEPYIFNKYIN